MDVFGNGFETHQGLLLADDTTLRCSSNDSLTGATPPWLAIDHWRSRHNAQVTQLPPDPLRALTAAISFFSDRPGDATSQR